MIEPLLPVAFLDASVLYPALLRNVLMHFAVADLFQAHWSARVHEEWMRSLLRDRPDISRQQLERTRDLMEVHVLGALVGGYEHRIDAITLPDADDRHVMAAALHCGAQTIVTANLRDFPESALAPFGLVAEHPDAFLSRVMGDSKELALSAFRELCANRRNPPQSPREVLEIMKRQGLPSTADALGALI
ncbi:PIN domain-containing protein [Methylocystis sp. Sn-Cys]|uniref:PIN domain-containing protein n=1 Tax=Methylocystis sp. Sn-Cys TaxID=1701263 RepID=UPI00192475C1|nr:PIN domain-containing protein [Methylocystis sp. Sn-Cys]MBL1257394.1 PIN domain-containing protein [Methylocystis sp. Sn-Cys]